MRDLIAAFERAMAAFGPWGARRVAVAVSGGADSLCLAWLARHWGAPHALIVDHGLRDGSAEEARLTAARLAALDIPYCVLTLRGVRASAAGAREARYAALTSAAQALGLSDLLLGHHAADQAETLALRAPRGSGPAGLAGMASVVVRNNLRLVRPLLGVQPGALRAALKDAGLAWVEDPSNSNPRYARARLRAGMSAAEQAELCDEAARQAGARAAAEAALAAILARHAAIFPEGYALLAEDALPPPALAAVLRTVAGRDYAPAPAAVAALAAQPRAAVLGGARLLPAGRLGRGWLVLREAALMAPPVPARDGAVWDRRFTLTGFVPNGTTLGPLGADAARFRAASTLPAAVLQTLPALRRGGALASVPFLGYHQSGFAAARTWFSPPHPVADVAFRHRGRGCEARGPAPC